MNKRIIGILLSYVLIIVDVIAGIMLVPILLGKLGDDEYGLYKLMFSTASYLSVLDFGIGGTITRYVVKFRVNREVKKEQNFLAMGLILYALLAFCVLLVAIVLSVLIPKIYAHSISADNYGKAQVIFLILCLNTAVMLFNHAYNGILVAYDKHIYNKSTNIIKICLRFILLIVGVNMFSSAIIIVLIDLSLSIILLLCNILYTKIILKCKIKLYNWDKTLFKESMIFTIAILAQTIINQFNSNLDNVVLGIYTTTQIITMYSLVLQFFTMYSSLSTAISGIYLPSIASAVFRGESDDEITDRIIEPSRLQLLILLLALSGFYLFGNQFLILWVGEGYESVFMLAAILMTCATLELTQNTITSVLKAKNILHGKTLILSISTVINAILTFLLVPHLGALGAVIGTSFSLLFGYGLVLNIYYHKVAKVNMIKYYKKTYKGIFISFIISFILGYGIVKLFSHNTLIYFIIEVMLYILVYIFIVGILGLNKTEKNRIKNTIKKILHKNKIV